MSRVKQYSLGDIFELELEGNGYKGYGRIIMIEKPSILIELYKIHATSRSSIPNPDQVDKILTIWSTDTGIKKGLWKIVGNQTVNEVELPDFWKIDAITDKYYLVRGDENIEITKDQIGDALPFGIFGHEAVRLRYLHELKRSNLN